MLPWPMLTQAIVSCGGYRNSTLEKKHSYRPNTPVNNISHTIIMNRPMQ